MCSVRFSPLTIQEESVGTLESGFTSEIHSLCPFLALNCVLIGKVIWINHLIPNCKKHNDFLGCERDAGKWNLSEGWWTDKNSIIDKYSLSTQDTQRCARERYRCSFPGMKAERPGWHTQTRTHMSGLCPHYFPFHFFLLCSFLHCFHFFMWLSFPYSVFNFIVLLQDVTYAHDI